jgi:putative transposase
MNLQCDLCKYNENYQLLNTDIAQQTLKVVDRTFQSFYGLIQAIKSRMYQQKVRLPHYLPKDGYFVLIIPRIKVKDGKFKVPMSHAFKKQFGEIVLNFPERLNPETIKEVRIHPKYDARFFEIEYICLSEIEPVETIENSSMAIDLGLDNLATCVDTNGASLFWMGENLNLLTSGSIKRMQGCNLLKINRRLNGLPNVRLDCISSEAIELGIT